MTLSGLSIFLGRGMASPQPTSSLLLETVLPVELPRDKAWPNRHRPSYTAESQRYKYVYMNFRWGSLLRWLFENDRAQNFQTYPYWAVPPYREWWRTARGYKRSIGMEDHRPTWLRDTRGGSNKRGRGPKLRERTPCLNFSTDGETVTITEHFPNLSFATTPPGRYFMVSLEPRSSYGIDLQFS